MTMTNFEKVYGLREMSIEEESKLSASEKLTVKNKLELIGKCNLMQQALDQIRSRAKGIPVLDDPKHAEAVQKLADLTAEAERILWGAATFGIK